MTNTNPTQMHQNDNLRPVRIGNVHLLRDGDLQMKPHAHLTDHLLSSRMESLCYSIVNAVYVGLCGITTSFLGFLNEESMVHKFLFVGGGELGAMLLTLNLVCSLALLGDVFFGCCFKKPPFRHRHGFYVVTAFSWAALLFSAVGSVSSGVQLFWMANIWLSVTTALIDAYSRGNRLAIQD